MSSRRPITRAEAKRILEAPIADAIDLINQFSLQDETPSESVPAENVRLEATFRVDSTTTSTNNHSGSEDPFEHTPPRRPLTHFSADSEEDTMPYPYPRYNGKADAEAHTRVYLQDSRVRPFFGWSSSELILAELRPTPGTIHPTVP